LGALGRASAAHTAGIVRMQIGRVLSVGDGVARISGLPGARAGEVLEIEGGARALVLDLDSGVIGAVLLDPDSNVAAGAKVRTTGEVATVPVGDGLIGRVIDPLGRVLDHGGRLEAAGRFPVERAATPIIHRAPVSVPLQTGILAVDAFVPVGRGQRELILGDRQTGKTAIALDAIINQKETGVVCVYAAIGQRASAVARALHSLRVHGALGHTVVVVAGSDDPPGLQYLAPYAAMSVAEYFMEQGRDALVVFDDLTKHAYAYRELSLILRRPPGREAFPSDIFYAHSRLLERATARRKEHGGGSVTALPIAETQAQNIAAYIPTNLISITDGQIYLDSELFHKNIRPAVDIGLSVSRVGGKSQLKAYRSAVANLKLAYSQFLELELFSRLGTRLDEHSEQVIRRGREIREILRQPNLSPIPAAEQVGLLVALTAGAFAELPLEKVKAAEERVRARLRSEVADILAAIERGEALESAGRERLIELGRAAAGEVARETAQETTGKASAR